MNRHIFTWLICEVHFGSWLEIGELGCQCDWAELVIYYYLIQGKLLLRCQTAWLQYSEYCTWCCSNPHTVCRHRLCRDPVKEYCKCIDLRQSPTICFTPGCGPFDLFANCQYWWSMNCMLHLGVAFVYEIVQSQCQYGNIAFPCRAQCSWISGGVSQGNCNDYVMSARQLNFWWRCGQYPPCCQDEE